MLPAHVYVHFPYCLRKCPYCDFASVATQREDVPHRAYADAVLRELDRRRAHLEERRLETVFFGGGTPSLWEPEELGRVLAGIRATARETAADVEVTIECNPTSLDEPRARSLLQAGATRLSIGVQSLSAERLAFLGRLHDAEGALRAIADARAAGFARVSGDLIFGVAGGAPQSPEDAAQEAATLADSGVVHLSAYALTIEPGTRFGELAKRSALPIAAEDDVAASFEAVELELSRRGFVHYEISNYAHPGEEARHNLAYWTGREYLGLGAGAVGAVGAPGGDRVRYRNDPRAERYLADPGGTVVEQELLAPETQLRERIMLGLRLAAGFDLGAAAAELGIAAWPRERRRTAERLVASGRLAMDGDHLRLPQRAFAFADGVAARLF